LKILVKQIHIPWYRPFATADRRRGAWVPVRRGHKSSPLPPFFFLSESMVPALSPPARITPGAQATMSVSGVDVVRACQRLRSFLVAPSAITLWADDAGVSTRGHGPLGKDPMNPAKFRTRRQHGEARNGQRPSTYFARIDQGRSVADRLEPSNALSRTSCPPESRSCSAGRRQLDDGPRLADRCPPTIARVVDFCFAPVERGRSRSGLPGAHTMDS